MRGWTMQRGVYLGNCDLFVCTRAEYPSPFFNSPPITFPLLQRSASCSFPNGDPTPCMMSPGSGSDLGFGSEIRWPKPATASQLKACPFPNKQRSSLEEQEQNKHIFTHSEICLCHVILFFHESLTVSFCH